MDELFRPPWQAHQVTDRFATVLRLFEDDAAARERLYRAYQLVCRVLGGRDLGDDSPVGRLSALATVVTEALTDEVMVCAAMLATVAGSRGCSVGDVRAGFGDEVADLVETVGKLDRIPLGEPHDMDVVRKLVVATAGSNKALILKLILTVGQLRTVGSMPRPEQRRVARTAMDVLAPLADHLGLETLKGELEELSFATLEPEHFESVARAVSQRAPGRDAFLRRVVAVVSADLREAGIRAEVTGRMKTYYAIHRDLAAGDVDLGDVYDLVGFRVIVGSVRDCYAVLGQVHARWHPLPGQFEDYIAMPKFDMYQSLHSTVSGPEAQPVELQIRTRDMHRRAQWGAAVGPRPEEREDEARTTGGSLSWQRRFLEWRKRTADTVELVALLRLDQEVFVFTPGGDVIALPRGATPIDLAYAVHTEVGDRCIGARVNGGLVLLDSELGNGDTVEIFTSRSPRAGPDRDWLSFVKTRRAKKAIKRWFAARHRDAAAEAGRGQEPPPGSGSGTDDDPAVGRARGIPPNLHRKRTPGRRNEGVIVAGDPDIEVRLSRCCTPVPGDEIFGFVTRGNGVSVHRAGCLNAPDLKGRAERLIDVAWSQPVGSVFSVAVQVEALDRAELLTDITRVLADRQADNISASVETTRDRVAVCRFSFEMRDPRELRSVLQAVRSVKGVYDAYRIKAT
ncbi:RelA/SpoT family protein [Actinomadura geliboluensis]|uniref:RelA/SpoT family protein n=1 Tax=Actinomadura geliboluensis TaxID=882440 RepID=UPI00371F1788